VVEILHSSGQLVIARVKWNRQDYIYIYTNNKTGCFNPSNIGVMSDSHLADFGWFQNDV
jgi:hypothetical protein